MDNQRELVLRLYDAEREAFAAMNSITQKYGLPCYLFEYIVDKIHRQLIDGRENEMLAAKVREAQRQTSETEEQE